MGLFLRAGGGDVRTRRAPTILPPPPVARKIDAIITPRRPVSEGVGPALGDERDFIHRKGSFLRRIGKKVLGGVPLVGGAATAIGEGLGIFESGGTGIPGRVPRVAAVNLVPRRSGGCPPGFIRSATGGCTPIVVEGARTVYGNIKRLFDGGDPADGTLAPAVAMGEAVMGRYGAGFEPEVTSGITRRCGRRHVLGTDGVCYNRTSISNKERFWPRGRRPLLTGGDMRAISTASAAAARLQKKQKQLRELGMLKAPPVRRAKAAAAPAHVKTAGVVHN